MRRYGPALVLFLLPLGGDGARSAGPDQAPPAPDPAAALRKELTDAGWSDDAAWAVAAVNADWFRVLQASDPDGLRRQTALLKRINNDGLLDDFLADHPELAAVLAAVRRPNKLAAALRGADCDRLASLFVALSAPEDMRDLSEAIIADHEIIARLLRRHVFGAEMAFLFPRDAEGAEDYDRWLRDEFDRRLDTSRESAADFLRIVLMEGRSLRRRMCEDKQFRDKWDKLRRVADQKKLPPEVVMTILDDPLVWKLLARADGEELLAEWGPLPAQLLYGKSAYPEELHDRVILALREGDNDVVYAMMRFRTEPLFRELLKRRLSREVRRTALHRLLADGPNAPARLKRYHDWTDDVLSTDLGPLEPEGLVSWLPLYYEVVVAEKLWQGRDVSVQEWVFAVADPALMAADLVPGLGEAIEIPGKIVTTAIEKGTAKVVEKVGLETLGEETAEAAAKGLTKEAGEQLTKKVAERVAEKFAQQELKAEANRWGASRLFDLMRGQVVADLDKATSVEITQPVRFLFENSPFGRESFKKLAGFVAEKAGASDVNLEARLFMRGDAHVYVHVGKWATNKAVDKAKGMFFDRLKQELIKAAEAASGDGSAAHQGPSEEELRVWRKDVSAWWLMSAAGPTAPAEK